MNPRSAPLSRVPRFLVIDDEPRNVDLIRTLLRSVDCEIQAAHGGREGLAEFDARTPDLVLLDVSMPDIDGIEVLRHIRSRPTTDHVPVVLVTGHGEPEARLRGFKAGADEFLEKPIDRSLLEVRIRTLLRLHATTEELARKSAALESLQREQRELTGFIVHDLRNPIAIAAMNIGFVRGELPAGSAIGPALADAECAMGRLSRMVSDLLMVARLEQDDAPLKSERVRLGALLGEVVDLHQQAAEDKQLTLNAPAGAASCDGNAATLRRAFETLVDNAIRRAPTGGRILVSLERAEGSPMVEIRIADTGAPIPSEQRARLFEKFARLDPQHAGAEECTGLGLHLCKRAVDAHRGEIYVEESAQWPVQFIVRLPETQPPSAT